MAPPHLSLLVKPTTETAQGEGNAEADPVETSPELILVFFSKIQTGTQTLITARNPLWRLDGGSKQAKIDLSLPHNVKRGPVPKLIVGIRCRRDAMDGFYPSSFRVCPPVCVFGARGGLGGRPVLSPTGRPTENPAAINNTYVVTRGFRPLMYIR